MVRLLCVVCVWVAGMLASTHVHAAEPADLRGVKVFPKERCVIQVGNDVLDPKQFNIPYVVQRVNGDWLWVGDNKKGWVHRNEVLTLDEAPTYYTAVINRQDTRKAWAYGMRALARAERGELDTALSDYEERVRLEPNKVAYNNRGNAWNAKREFDKALADYNQALLLDPNSAGTYGNRGNAWYRLKEYEKAIADYDEAIRLDPARSIIYRNRGNAWYRRKEFDKALADFDKAVRLDTNDAAAYVCRGNAWSAKKQYDTAIADFDHAIHLGAKSGSVYGDRGNAWYAKKEFDKALADYRQAIQLDPKLAYPYNNIAWLNATATDEKYRDGKQAVELATKACELCSWTNSYRIGTLAAAYAETGDFDNAIKFQTKAIELNPADTAFVKGAQARTLLYLDRKPYRE